MRIKEHLMLKRSCTSYDSTKYNKKVCSQFCLLLYYQRTQCSLKCATIQCYNTSAMRRGTPIISNTPRFTIETLFVFYVACQKYMVERM